MARCHSTVVLELMTIISGVHSFVQAHSFHYYGQSPTSLIVSTKRTWNESFRFFYTQNGRNACINDVVSIKRQTAEQCVWRKSQWQKQDDGESHSTYCVHQNRESIWTIFLWLLQVLTRRIHNFAYMVDLFAWKDDNGCIKGWEDEFPVG